MFGRKKSPARGYDREHLEPVIRRSICTGEETAGFLEIGSTRFHEDRLLRSSRDLRDFMEEYGLSAPPRTIY